MADKAVSDTAFGDEHRSARERMVRSQLIPRGISDPRVLKAFNGTMGWREHAPFDAIIVTAGAPDIPPPLLDQLADGGRLVIPVGDRLTQQLIKVIRDNGDFFKEDLGPVRFVNLKGVYGRDE
jgi:protein-L-isoaspartate(D-aspartate) O-methyltransferase